MVRKIGPADAAPARLMTARNAMLRLLGMTGLRVPVPSLSECVILATGPRVAGDRRFRRSQPSARIAGMCRRSLIRLARHRGGRLMRPFAARSGSGFVLAEAAAVVVIVIVLLAVLSIWGAGRAGCR